MARDILAVPAITVASKAAFSVVGRDIDKTRASLLPDIVEALVTTNDWIESHKKSFSNNTFCSYALTKCLQGCSNSWGNRKECHCAWLQHAVLPNPAQKFKLTIRKPFAIVDSDSPMSSILAIEDIDCLQA